MHEGLTQDAPWQAVVSGLATGLACVFERPSRVNDLMLYCLPHSIMAVVAFAHSNAADVGARQALPTHVGMELACFAVACAAIFGTHPSEMKPIIRRSTRTLAGKYV